MPVHASPLFPSLAIAPFLLACGNSAPANMATMIAPGVTSIAFVDSASLQPIVEDSNAQVIHGPQGGYHILTTLLAHGIWPGTLGIPGSPDDPVTTLRAFHADGTEVTLTTDNVDTFHIAYMPAGDGASLSDKQLRFAITSPAAIANERLLISVDVTDRDARTAHDEKHVVAIPPTN